VKSARDLEVAETLLKRVVGRRFYLERFLGLGGTAAVYEAEDLLLQRPVAVKILLPERRRCSESTERLRREAFAAARLNHPNVNAVVDLGVLDDGSPFVVMERLVGESLQQRLARERRLSVGEAVDIAMQILSGLSAVHDADLVHRDIKPGNVLLSTRRGYGPLAKIIDFGASTSIGAESGLVGDAALTAAGLVMGTPSYLSPEQLSGGRCFHPSVDLYACGVVLFEMLTGHKPFEAEQIIPLFHSILEHPMPSIRAMRPEVPEALEDVVRRALAKEPSERPQSATEMQALLADAVADGPVSELVPRSYRRTA
jgi:serine/threonine-protein kinase